jgi:hypothetical protein
VSKEPTNCTCPSNFLLEIVKIKKYIVNCSFFINFENPLYKKVKSIPDTYTLEKYDFGIQSIEKVS